MYTIFLAGGIGSGKSTASRELERLGARRLDLDQLSREVLAPGSPTLADIAAAFGTDLVDASTGELDRALLAARAFATPEASALLERIELPAIRERLKAALAELRSAADAPCLCVVEVPLLDRLADARDLADEVVLVHCLLEERMRRAVARGMDAHDAAARAANQPTDEWLLAHADTVLDNTGSPDDLLAQVRTLWGQRGGGGAS